MRHHTAAWYHRLAHAEPTSAGEITRAGRWSRQIHENVLIWTDYRAVGTQSTLSCSLSHAVMSIGCPSCSSQYFHMLSLLPSVHCTSSATVPVGLSCSSDDDEGARRARNQGQPTKATAASSRLSQIAPLHCPVFCIHHSTPMASH